VHPSRPRHPCEASDDTSSRAIACRNDTRGPVLDPALSGMQKAAAQDVAVGFLDLHLRMAMSISIVAGLFIRVDDISAVVLGLFCLAGDEEFIIAYEAYASGSPTTTC
jgi:hypothetical protein